MNHSYYFLIILWTIINISNCVFIGPDCINYQVTPPSGTKINENEDLNVTITFDYPVSYVLFILNFIL